MIVSPIMALRTNGRSNFKAQRHTGASIQRSGVRAIKTLNENASRLLLMSLLIARLARVQAQSYYLCDTYCGQDVYRATGAYCVGECETITP